MDLLKKFQPFLACANNQKYRKNAVLATTLFFFFLHPSVRFRDLDASRPLPTQCVPLPGPCRPGSKQGKVSVMFCIQEFFSDRADVPVVLVDVGSRTLQVLSQKIAFLIFSLSPCFCSRSPPHQPFIQRERIYSEGEACRVMVLFSHSVGDGWHERRRHLENAAFCYQFLCVAVVTPPVQCSSPLSKPSDYYLLLFLFFLYFNK